MDHSGAGGRTVRELYDARKKGIITKNNQTTSINHESKSKNTMRRRMEVGLTNAKDTMRVLL